MTNVLIAGAKCALRETIDDLEYWRRRRRHRSSWIGHEADDKIIAALRSTGGHLSSLEALALPGTAEMLQEADELFGLIVDRGPGKGGFLATASQEEINAQPTLLRWGLNERLLAIVEDYICMPVDYRGVTVRRDIKGGEQLETRLWHRDYEDIRIVKVIVYLNDVDRGGGAYEFIPRQLVPIWRVGPLGQRVDDADMARIVPRSSWQTCRGPRGTVVITDTCSVYHRGTIAETQDRLALFFCYNSRSPRSPQYCAPLFDRARFAAAARDLTLAQRAAIGCG
jgi:hypothetical protein